MIHNAYNPKYYWFDQPTVVLPPMSDEDAAAYAAAEKAAADKEPFGNI